MSPLSSATARQAIKPTDTHRPEIKAEQEKADGDAGQDGMRQRIAHQAHAAQLQEDAQGSGDQRHGDDRHQRPAHEGKIDKRADQSIVEHGVAQAAQISASG